MSQAIGIFVAAVVGLIVAINAAFMLISPRAWFRLPAWLNPPNSLSRKRNTKGLGSVELRLTGAALLGLIGWILYDIFLAGR